LSPVFSKKIVNSSHDLCASVKVPSVLYGLKSWAALRRNVRELDEQFQRREWKSKHRIRQASPLSAVGLFWFLVLVLLFVPVTRVYFVIQQRNKVRPYSRSYNRLLLFRGLKGILVCRSYGGVGYNYLGTESYHKRGLRDRYIA